MNNNTKPMTKIVNINARFPIKSIVPPIYGTLKNVEMSTSNILKCLIRHAIIEEVLPDGTTIPINYKNYYTDNYKEPISKKEIIKTVSSNNKPEITKNDLIDKNIDIKEISPVQSIDQEINDDIEDDESTTEEEISQTENSNNQISNHQNYNRNKKHKKRH